ncbi:MAG TPA: hypothetical protein VNU72_03575 [Puia sp.]|jgi:hypothetical protein|nr:hypothetical protein [Puia sp.]
MTPIIRYEILDHLPTYGPMYSPVTSTGEQYYSEGFAIRFFKSDGNNWVANFKPGWTELRTVIELSNTANLLIIANGTCYLMDPDQTNPVEAFGVGYSAIFKAGTERYVLQDQSNLTIIESDGHHWNTERISWDGLKDLIVAENIIKGLSFDPIKYPGEWVSFSYDLNSKLLTGGSYKGG